MVTELGEGNPVEEIVAKSKNAFDLIVLGARELSTMRKFLVGSVSEGVVKNAPCPVLIMKQNARRYVENTQWAITKQFFVLLDHSAIYCALIS